MNAMKSTPRVRPNRIRDIAIIEARRSFANIGRASTLKAAVLAGLLALLGAGFCLSAAAQDAGSGGETSRENGSAPSRGASRAAYVPRAGAFEGFADPSAVSAERVATNFGSVKAGQVSTPAVVRFTFKRSATLGAIDVVTKGIKGLDFDDAQTGTCKAGVSYLAGNTCTVHVTFKPRYAGARSGAVILRDEDGEPLGVHPLFGSGLEAMIAYEPGTLSTVEQSSESSSCCTSLGILGNPVGLALDGSGNIYVADLGLDTLPAGVYELAPGGASILKTIGSGWVAPSAVAVDGSGNLYVTDSGTGDVYKETPSGNTYTQSLVASGFGNPDAVAVDGSGNIVVCDFGGTFNPNFDPLGFVYLITNIGGNESSQTLLAQPLSPSAAAFDAQGDLFVSSQLLTQFPGGAVYELTPQNESSSYSPPNLISHAFGFVSGLALDPAGDIYVSDSNLYGSRGLGGVFELSPSASGYVLSTIFNDNQVADAQALALDASANLYFSAYANDGFGDITTNLNFVDYADAPNLTFPTTVPGSPDPPQTVTIANVGNNMLRFAIPASGRNPSISAGYLLDTSSPGTCPSVPSTASDVGTLLSGASCTLPITFDPPAQGSFPGTVVMTDNNLLAPGPDDAVQTIQLQGIVAGPTTRLILSAPGSVDMSQPFSVTVTAVDSLGNTTPAYGGTVHFTSTDPNAVLPPDTTLTNGTGSFSATLATLGSQTITGTDTGSSSITGVTGSITVLPTQLVLSAPGSAGVNQAFSLTVTAEDSLGNTLSGYSGTVHFTSSDAFAQLPADTTLSSGTGTFNVTLLSAGTQTITGTDTVTSSITGTTTIAAIPTYFVVTTNQDDSGNAANCTAQAAPGTGSDASCSLRDATLAASANGSGSITFDSTKFTASNTSAANTITLGSAGPISFGPSTTLTGATTGSGATLRNLVTVSGNNASSAFGNSSQPVTISNLTIANAIGGALTNSGNLVVANCTFFNNSSTDPNTGDGGAINNIAAVTVMNSTFSGNSATVGGAIWNQGGVIVINSTFSGNTASSNAGAIYDNNSLSIMDSTISGNSTLTPGAVGGVWSTYGGSFANTIISGNNAGSGADAHGNNADKGGNLVGVANIELAPLGSYGGPTQTMPPLPGSPALCNGTLANANAAGIADDQRGLPFDPLCPAGAHMVDSGAVQATYAMAFTTEPPSNAIVGQAMSPSPVVRLTESGVPMAAATNSIAISDSASALGGTTSASLASGSATFGNLVINSAQSSDTLTATLSLNPALTPPLNLTAQSTTFSVTASTSQPQTITFTPPSTVTYGVAPITLTATSTSSLTVSLQFISGPASLSGSVLTITGAGSVVIKATQGGNGAFAPATPVLQTIIVSPAVLKVNAFSYSRTYTAALPATYAYSITGFVNGDTSAAVTGQPAMATTATSASTPGSYPITPSLGSLSSANYTFQFQVGTLTITPAVLNVSAYSYTRTYGAPLPSPFAYAIKGFVNGDTISVVSGTPAIGTTATSSSPVGTYPITPTLGTLSATRYTFHFINGTLTIAPTVLKVAAYNYARYYRAALPSPFGYSLTGLMNADTAATATTGTPSITTTATQGSPAATYPITAAIGTFATTQNYTLEFQGATLTITPVPVLTVTAYSYTRSYGAALPSTFAYSITGFVGSDTMSIVSGAPVVGTTATSSSPAGAYAITPTIGTLSTTGNYTFQFAAGTLTVAPAVLKVTAYNYTRRVGEALPAQFEYTITGFEHGDTASTAVTGAPSMTTTAIQGSPAGTYPITPATGTLSTTGNYTFTFIDGTLTITN
jgi:hypothetical protein